MPFIRATPGGPGPGSIPDFLRVDPDEASLRAERMKETVQGALKPTDDLIAKVIGNQQVRCRMSPCASS